MLGKGDSLGIASGFFVRSYGASSTSTGFGFVRCLKAASHRSDFFSCLFGASGRYRISNFDRVGIVSVPRAGPARNHTKQCQLKVRALPMALVLAASGAASGASDCEDEHEDVAVSVLKCIRTGLPPAAVHAALRSTAPLVHKPSVLYSTQRI